MPRGRNSGKNRQYKYKSKSITGSGKASQAQAYMQVGYGKQEIKLEWPYITMCSIPSVYTPLSISSYT